MPNTALHPPAVIVFDLGGVLVDWNGTDPLVRLTGGRLSREQARRFWMETPWVSGLDTGQLSPADFASTMADALQLDLDQAQMLQALDDWLQGPYPGVQETLSRLSTRHRLAVLSNNNALHWGKIDREFDLLRHFPQQFASHQLGLRKPDAAIYRHVRESLAVEPGDILFFDDNIECVEAARAEGWQACHTVGFVAVQAELAKRGLLD